MSFKTNLKEQEWVSCECREWGSPELPVKMPNDLWKKREIPAWYGAEWMKREAFVGKSGEVGGGLTPPSLFYTQAEHTKWFWECEGDDKWKEHKNKAEKSKASLSVCQIGLRWSRSNDDESYKHMAEFRLPHSSF